jgi:hypothetical protein
MSAASAQNNSVRRAHPIHRFFAWLEKSPLPSWAFYLLLLIVPGIYLQLQAWQGLPPSERTLDPFHIFSTIWLVEGLALAHFITSASKTLLDNYRPQLPYSDQRYQIERATFTTIPFGLGLFFNLIGAIVGYYTAVSFSNGFPGIDRGAPIYFAALYALAFSVAMMVFVLVLRQLALIGQFFRDTEKIKISSLSSIYAFSRYTAIVAIWIFFIGNVNAVFILPEVYENPISAGSVYFLIATALAVFYFPLRGINQRLVAEKEHLLEEVTLRIESTFARIHDAHDQSDFFQISGLRSMLSALKEERDMIETVPTWPWRPGTVTGLLSALFLPTILSIVSTLLESFLNL